MFAGFTILEIIMMALIAPDFITFVGDESLSWVIEKFGWMFGMLAVAIALFMLVVGYGRTGGIRLGADDEKPEFATMSWVAMMFSAGMGIGLLFYGPYEPLTYFLDLPSGFNAANGTSDESRAALAQPALHWGRIAWRSTHSS